jgi:hypothetical protein
MPTMKVDARPRPARKYIPLWIRVKVAERQFFASENPDYIAYNALLDTIKVGTGDGRRLKWLLRYLFGDKPYRLDHRPPIQDRPINRKGDDYKPHQLDPRHLEYITPGEHDRRTFGKKEGQEKAHTTIGSDAWRRAKFNRLEGRTKKKPKRQFPKGRKLESRGFEKKKKPAARKGSGRHHQGEKQ